MIDSLRPQLAPSRISLSSGGWNGEEVRQQYAKRLVVTIARRAEVARVVFKIIAIIAQMLALQKRYHTILIARGLRTMHHAPCTMRVHRLKGGWIGYHYHYHYHYR